MQKRRDDAENDGLELGEGEKTRYVWKAGVESERYGTNAVRRGKSRVHARGPEGKNRLQRGANEQHVTNDDWKKRNRVGMAAILRIE